MVIIGAESVVYEGTLDGDKVAVKKPILSTSEDINKYHKELQLLWSLSLSLYLHPSDYVTLINLNACGFVHLMNFIPYSKAFLYIAA